MRSESQTAAIRREPPLTTSFRWCPVCERDDRSIPFTGKSHFWRGARCSGTPITVVYEFKEALDA